MGSYRAGIPLVLCLVLLVASPAIVAAADSPSRLSAKLDGQPIPASDVAKYYCHDLAYPMFECFSTEEALEQQMLTARRPAAVYVTIYSEPTYDGTYAHLSQDYPGLWSIGWNDRISSYKARNGESGRFFEDWYGGGASSGFCCNQTEPVLGGDDNTFSSVYRT